MIFLNDDHVGAGSQIGFLNMSLNLTSALLPTRVKRECSLKFINSEYKVYRKMRPSNHSLSDWLQFLLLWLHKIRKTEISEASGVSKSSVLGENRQVRNNLGVWSDLGFFLCVCCFPMFLWVLRTLNPTLNTCRITRVLWPLKICRICPVTLVHAEESNSWIYERHKLWLSRTLWRPHIVSFCDIY